MCSLNLATSVKNNTTDITREFVQLKLKNTSDDIEDEAVEVSPISVVDVVDKCGVLEATCVENRNIYFYLIRAYQKFRILVIIMMYMK